MCPEKSSEDALHDAVHTPAVSIIIPAYNEESVIRQCLIAAVYQSVPAHEIIVVDNMSKDRTADIVRQMQLEYPESPIILLSQDRDQGLIPTRNFRPRPCHRGHPGPDRCRFRPGARLG